MARPTRAPGASGAHPADPAFPAWLAAGAISGTAATVPMTAVMMALHRALPRRHRDPLPPRRIVLRLAGLLGVRGDMHEPSRTGATLAAHFGFGAATGALYAPIAAALPNAPARAAGGVAYALLIWLVSYAGWLPAVGLYAPLHNDAAPRSALMAAAHVVWGAAAGLLVGPAAAALGRQER